MKRFCDSEFWMPFMGFLGVALGITLIVIALVAALMPKEFRGFYISKNIGTYTVYQNVRWGTDVEIYTATNPESSLVVYRQLTGK